MKQVAFLYSNYINDAANQTELDFDSCIELSNYQSEVERKVDADDQPIDKCANGKITIEFPVGPQTDLYSKFYEGLCNMKSESFSLFFNLRGPADNNTTTTVVTMGDCSFNGSLVFDGYITSVLEEYKQNKHIENSSKDLYLTVEILASNIIYIGEKDATGNTYNTVGYQFSN